MNRTAANYYRDEARRLTDRLCDVQRETEQAKARLVELQREQALLDELLSSLSAHVPEVDVADPTAEDAKVTRIA